MTGRYEESFVGMFDGVDEIIRATENPRHRAILLNYRRHGLLEVSQRWPEVMDPSMMVDHPVYRMNEGGTGLLFDGREQVAGFYRMLEGSGAAVPFGRWSSWSRSPTGASPRRPCSVTSCPGGSRRPRARRSTTPRSPTS